MKNMKSCTVKSLSERIKANARNLSTIPILESSTNCNSTFSEPVEKKIVKSFCKDDKELSEKQKDATQGQENNPMIDDNYKQTKSTPLMKLPTTLREKLNKIVSESAIKSPVVSNREEDGVDDDIFDSYKSLEVKNKIVCN